MPSSLLVASCIRVALTPPCRMDLDELDLGWGEDDHDNDNDGEASAASVAAERRLRTVYEPSVLRANFATAADDQVGLGSSCAL